MPEDKGKTGPAILAALERIEKKQTEQDARIQKIEAFVDAAKASESDDDDDY